MTIKAGFVPRLPATRFDGVGSVDIFVPIISTTFTFETFPVTAYSWEGRALGGAGQYNWPVAGSPGMLATWQGSTLDDIESSYLDVAPARYFGRPGSVLRRQRAVLWGTGTLLPAEVALVEPAVLAAIAGHATALAAKGVYAAQGPSLERGFGQGLMASRWPWSNVVLVEDATFGFGTAIGFQPVYEPDSWVAGEVLYISVGYGVGTEIPFAVGSNASNIEALNLFRASEQSLWHSVIPRHSRVSHHNVYVQQAIGEITAPDPAFDAARLASAQEFFDTLDNTTLDLIEGTLADQTAAITASVSAAIADFFGL